MAGTRIALLCTPGSVNDNPLLRFNIGQWQLYDPILGKFLTYSQNGGFSNAVRDGAYIVANGPDPNYPTVRVPSPRVLPDSNIFGLGTTSGQSTDVAATTGSAIDADIPDITTNFLTKLAPAPGKLYMFPGGSFPSHKGAGAPAATALWNTNTYQGALRDLVQGTNDFRDVDKFAYRETPGTTTALRIATAMNDTCKLLLCEPAAGSNAFADVCGYYNPVVAAVYNGGTLKCTYTLTTTTHAVVGEQFTPYNCNPAGFNTGGIVTAVTLSGGVLKVVEVSMAVDPGTPYVASSGNYRDYGLPFQSLFKAAVYWRDNLVPVGMTPWYMFHKEVGHEGDSAQGNIAAALTQYTFLRDAINQLATLINPAMPLPVLDWVQNDYLRLQHGDQQVFMGQIPMQAQMVEYVAQLGTDTRFTTGTTFTMPSAGVTLFGSPHYDMAGNPKFGSKGGDNILDLLLGTYQTPVMMNADWHITLDQPTKIIGTFNANVRFYHTEILTPTTEGVQVWNRGASIENVQTIQPLSDVTLSSVAISGGNTLTITGAAPFDPRGLEMGIGFKRPLIKAMINYNLIAANWGAANGGTRTMQFAGPIDTAVGETLSVFQVTEPDWNVIPYTACLGTTVDTLVVFPMSDPGAWLSGTGRAARDGTGPVGMAHGNRHTIIRDEAPIRHTDITQGGDNPDYALAGFRTAYARTSVPGLTAMDAEITAVYPAWATMFGVSLDFAESACFNGVGTTITNQGFAANSSFTLTNFALQGVADSKSRLTWLQATGVAKLIHNNAGITMWQNSHKPGQRAYGVMCFTYFDSGAVEMVASTCAGQGGGAVQGIFWRISNDQLIPSVRGAANVAVYTLNTGVALVNGHTYIAGFYCKDGAGVSLAGKAWTFQYDLTADTFTIVEDNNCQYVSASSGASSKFDIGNNPPLNNVNLPSGTKIFWMRFGDSQDVFFRDWKPFLNSVIRRQSQDVY